MFTLHSLRNKISVLVFIFALFIQLLIPSVFPSGQLYAQEGAQPAGFLDESLQDIYVVLGVGAAGAILGLSTLSFAERPKDHLKNIAVGGAIGIVIGVGVVIFGQATKSQNSLTANLYESPQEMTPDKAERLSRKEFADLTAISMSASSSYLGTQLPSKFSLPTALNFNFTF